MKKIILMVILIVLCVSGCNENVKMPKENKINIVVTSFPYYDFARAVAKDNAEITLLIKPGASTHSFDPSISDVSKIGKADVFIYNGGENETWVEKILTSVSKDKMHVMKMIDFADTLPEEIIGEDHEHEHDNEGEKIDEHVWTSPQNALKFIDEIQKTLTQADPQNAENYKKNADEYKKAIVEVQKEIEKIVETSKTKTIVVADRFPLRYFTNEFGLSYHAAFGGCSDQTDASPAIVVNLIEEVKSENLNYIFYIELSNQNIAKTVSEQTGAQMLILHSCQNVTLSEFESGETYVSLMQKNAENLKKGLN